MKRLTYLLLTLVMFFLNINSVGAEEIRSYSTPTYQCYVGSINKDFNGGVTERIPHYCVSMAHSKGLIKVDGNVPQRHIQEIADLMYKVPQNVLNSFINRGYYILLTSKDIRDYGYSVSFAPAGIFDPNRKRIVLSNGGDNDWGKHAILHEFGHYVDHILGLQNGIYGNYNAFSSSMESLYKEEYSKFKVDVSPSYYQQSALEYFAQGFSEYLTNPTRLNANTPKTYKYFEDNVWEVR